MPGLQKTAQQWMVDYESNYAYYAYDYESIHHESTMKILSYDY